MSTRPFFSIIIPTYNRASFIEKTIRSLLNQTFKDFEVIVVDDGSTDNTQQIMRGIDDKRMVYFIRENEERGAARNAGAKVAQGKYLNFFDSDDIAYSNHLDVAYNFIKNIEPKIFHLDFEILKGDFKKKSILKSNDDLNQLMVNGNPLSCNGVFILNEIFDNFKFNEDRKISGSEDYELWLRIASQYNIYNVSEITSCIREHEERSVFTMEKERLIQRKLLMLHYAFKNKDVIRFYGKYRNKMQSHAYTYIALHIALSKKDRSSAFKYLRFAFAINPLILFERRFYAIGKHLLSKK